MLSSSSSVFNRTSTLFTFPMPSNIIYSYLHQHIPRESLHASSCFSERWSSARMKIKAVGNLFIASMRGCGWRKENIYGL